MRLNNPLLIVFLVLLLSPDTLLRAAELAGTVEQTAGPYLLVKTDGGYRVVRTDKGTAYGNLVGPGVLKYGGERVRVVFDVEVAGVPQAAAVVRETEYAASAEMSVTAAQVAAGIVDRSITLVDCRSRQEWEEARLPGAVLFAGADELKRRAGETGTGGGIVAYGTSKGDLRPFSIVRQLLAAGFTWIKVYDGGVREWRRQGKAVHTSPAHLEHLLSSGTPFRVIDLRRADNAQPPLLEGAEVLPLDGLHRSAIFLPARAYQLPMYLYGDEGDLLKAAELLAGWGYHNDGDFALLDASWREWPGRYTSGSQHPGALPPGEIGYDEFRALWSGTSRSRAVLLNVKPGRDRETSGEIHIPLEELPERLKELPRDREIIIYCSLGLRSAVAQRILQQNGFSSRFLNRTLQLDAAKKPQSDLQ